MIEPEEARLLFAKWCEDRTRLLCIADFPHVGLTLEGFADAPSSEMFSVFSADRKSSFSLRWDEGLKFEYCEVSGLPIPPLARAVSVIGVALPFRGTRRDVIFFVELEDSEEDVDT
jgi:hypothetical protein